MLIPPGVAYLFGRLARARGEERRWSWVVLVALSGPGAACGLLSLAVGSRSFPTILYLVIDAVMLVHPDGRKVLEPPQPPIQVGPPRDTTGAGW